VAVTPDASKVYVANAVSGNVSVIDTATNTVVNVPGSCAPAICVGSISQGVAVTPDGSKVYVANAGSGASGSVSVIDTPTNTVIGSPIPVGSFPFGVAVTPDGSKVYVANEGSGASGSVSVIDTATNTVIGSPIAVGGSPTAFGIFIIRPSFAGTQGFSNCLGQSVAALSNKYGTLSAAAAALTFPKVQTLQNAIAAFCHG
jgi:YVTN family beta-propeller protein